MWVSNPKGFGGLHSLVLYTPLDYTFIGESKPISDFVRGNLFDRIRRIHFCSRSIEKRKVDTFLKMAKMACFGNFYCVAVSQSFLKTAVFTFLRTLPYYSRTKVSNIRQNSNCGPSDEYSCTERYRTTFAECYPTPLGLKSTIFVRVFPTLAVCQLVFVMFIAELLVKM